MGCWQKYDGRRTTRFLKATFELTANVARRFCGKRDIILMTAEGPTRMKQLIKAPCTIEDVDARGEKVKLRIGGRRNLWLHFDDITSAEINIRTAEWFDFD